MRYGILMTLLLWCFISYAQTILVHEKKVDIALKYQAREINFLNSTDNTLLSGTLIEPNSEYKKIVIIVPGSGKDTRHSHYKLAQELLEKNIAVYRFDDRGVGKSEGFYSNSIQLLAADIVSANRKLKSLHQLRDKEIGILSHSLGGMATVIAYNYIKDTQYKFDFLIQLASPVDSFAKSTKYQIKTLPVYNINHLSTQETEDIFSELLNIVRNNSNLTTSQIQQKGLDYLQSNKIDINQVKFWSYTHILLYQYKFEDYYKLLDVPTMYLIGSKDKYVNANEEITLLKKVNNPKITSKVLSDLNHYLTKSNFNNKDIYAIDKKASQSIIQWINRI